MHFCEVGRLVQVARLEKEGNTRELEGDLISDLVMVLFQKLLNGGGYMSFADVAVGSHGVRDELQVDDHVGGGGSHCQSSSKSEDEWEEDGAHYSRERIPSYKLF